MPAWTPGVSVFTRPVRMLGACVYSDTSSTLSPASRSALAVPPVDTSSTPWCTRNVPSATSPVLSDTDSTARDTRRSDSVLPFTAT